MWKLDEMWVYFYGGNRGEVKAQTIFTLALTLLWDLARRRASPRVPRGRLTEPLLESVAAAPRSRRCSAVDLASGCG